MAAPKQQAEQPQVWSMPVPRSGTVKWRYFDGSGGECFALVTKVYESMIDVLVFAPGSAVGQIRQGVRHVTDPALKRMSNVNPSGVWDFTDFEKSVRDFMRQS